MIKNRSVLVSLIGVHLVFVVLHIHKSSRFVQESYRAQHHETARKELEREKEELLYSLSTLQSRSSIQTFARSTLGMRSITLNQINKLK